MEISKDNLLQFVKARKRDFPFLGVVLTGSTARGYSMESSDVDLMAFYDAGYDMVPESDFFVEDDKQITIEHHDLGRFIDDTIDHRFNLASLRILNKAKDAVVLEGEQALRGLTDIAKRAQLDVSAMLWVLKEMIGKWDDLLAADAGEQREYFIGWTELLTSLRLLCDRKAPSYSKPKWLYQNIRDANLGQAKHLLDYLYQVDSFDAKAKLAALRHLEGLHPLESLPNTNRGFFKLVGRECREMADKFPTEAGPVFRFTARSYYWLLFGGEPASMLRKAAAFEEAEFEVFFERQPPGAYSSAKALELFYAFVVESANKAVEVAESNWRGSIMSRKFVPYFLLNYGVPELLPFSHKPTDIFPAMKDCESPERWLQVIKLFLAKGMAF